MIIPDINILVYAHRADSPYHLKGANAVDNLVKSLSPFALCSFVCSGFLRIVTNHRIFMEPTPLLEGIRFIESLLELENCRIVEPRERHWEIFSTFLKETRATGNLISDAYLASIVVEHGLELMTHDSDFKRFVELKICPL